MAFVAIGLFWAAAVPPLFVRYFTSAIDRLRLKPTVEDARAILPGHDRNGCARCGFLPPWHRPFLTASGVVAYVSNFLPILTTQGHSSSTAGWIVSLAGMASFAGRLGSGMLCDRFSGPLVMAGIDLLPILRAAALLLLPGYVPSALLAAILFYRLTLMISIPIGCWHQHFSSSSGARSLSVRRHPAAAVRSQPISNGARDMPKAIEELLSGGSNLPGLLK